MPVRPGPASNSGPPERGSSAALEYRPLIRDLPAGGEAKASQVLAALEMGRRLLTTHPDERPYVRSPEDIANLLLADMALLEQEHLRVVLLNTKNQVMAGPEGYKGTVNPTHIRMRGLLR